MRRTVGLGVLVTALTLVGLAAAAAPGNDAFPGAVIAGASGTTSAMTAEATPETGEPALGGVSVWYAWEAPSSATYGFCATPGTAWNSPDTLLGAYTGSGVDALSEVAFNDDGGWDSRGSFLSIAASAGTTYHLGVGGFEGSSGPFTLTWKEGECQPPDTSITQARVKGKKLELWFEGSDDTTPTADLTFECRLDTGAWAPCTSPVLLAATGGGSHTGYVRATDANGNVEAFPDSDTRALHGRA